jgi:organic radical activating enzyme
MSDERQLAVNEIFYSIQGEGYWIGTPMVFVRLAGCNLRCPWCDTKYALSGGHLMDLGEILEEIRKVAHRQIVPVCLTGGEPTIQKIKPLIAVLHTAGHRVHIETNGTMSPEEYMAADWITVSPKTYPGILTHVQSAALRVASEVKVVLDGDPAVAWAKKFEPLTGTGPTTPVCLYVQPESMRPEMMDLCVQFVKANPRWRVSPQLHKILNVR